MQLVRPTRSDIRHVTLRARYAELLRLREFVKRMEDSTTGGVNIKLDERVWSMRRGVPGVSTAGLAVPSRTRPASETLHNSGLQSARV
jgi:hypothetical protein